MNNKDKLLVEPQKFSYEKKFDLESGDSLEGFEIVYETYGQLNESKSNATESLDVPATSTRTFTVS